MPSVPSPHKPAVLAEQHVADFFRADQWSVEVEPEEPAGADLIIQRGWHRFVVEIKAVSEARPDRVLPVLSMAILQARAAAREAGNALPLAIIFLPQAPLSLARQVESFALRYASDMAIGVLSGRGEQYFFGSDAFQQLNRFSEEPSRRVIGRVPQPINLFSDLNQWLLKLLLASELPEGLLNAPKRQYSNGADLAEAAQVSAMSVSRFLQQLRVEEYLDASHRYLRLVRREDLFRRWRAAAMRSAPEMPCRLLLRAPAAQQLLGMLVSHSDDACFGLFAAADELGIGHVSGVPPYIYVRKLPIDVAADWPGLMAFPSDRPDLILRQAAFPQSTFRGAVNHDGYRVADIVQVWLDVSNHPSRGAEQAELIYREHLQPLVDH